MKVFSYPYGWFPLIRWIALLLSDYQNSPILFFGLFLFRFHFKAQLWPQGLCPLSLASIYLCVGGTAEQRMPCWEGARSRPRQEASQHSLCQVTELSLQKCCVPGPRLEGVVVRKGVPQHALCILRGHWELRKSLPADLQEGRGCRHR